MSGVQIADAKAPYVTFEIREEEDRTKSVETGRYVAKDICYAVITPHGSKDQIERVAAEWLDNMDQQVKEGRLPRDWAKAYRHAFEEFKAGRAIPLEGTPIANWPMCSPAQVRNLQSMHILTVEVLAAANEEVIGRLGMGGRDLVNRAKEFLKQAEGPGKAAAQITSLEQQITDLRATVENLQQTNAQLASANKQAGAGNTFGQREVEDDDLGLGKKL